MGHLTLKQRYKIETYLSLGRNKSEIAAYIGKDKSVISREIKRNADARSGVYKAALADKKAKLRHQTKAKKTRFNAEIKARVEEKKHQILEEAFSYANRAINYLKL